MEIELVAMTNMFYNNVDPRRKQELTDSRMVQEDRGSMANLSNVAQYHTFDANVYPERLAMFNQSTKTKR